MTAAFRPTSSPTVDHTERDRRDQRLSPGFRHGGQPGEHDDAGHSSDAYLAAIASTATGAASRYAGQRNAAVRTTSRRRWPEARSGQGADTVEQRAEHDTGSTAAAIGASTTP